MKVINYCRNKSLILGHKFSRRIKSLNRDERGLETLQVVLIIAVAAVVLAVVLALFPGIKNWAWETVEAITGGDWNPNKS